MSGTVQELGLAARAAALADIVALTKPRILTLVLITATGGLMLAPGAAALPVAVALLVGTALIVGSANALNMYLEREVDRHMARTCNRPLPAGRMEPGAALVFGLGLAFTGVPILTFGVNPLTGMLGVIAHLSYVLVYTPLKQRTPVAVWVGAVPGAMPPLLGWTAVTAQLTWGALAVFALMLLWQVPHFHAIAMFRVEEYRRAGLKTLPGEHGLAAARRSIALVLMAHLAASLAIYTVGVAGPFYLAAALVLGLGYLAYAIKGYLEAGGPAWARKLFFFSLVYLPVIFAVLVLDGRL